MFECAMLKTKMLQVVKQLYNTEDPIHFLVCAREEKDKSSLVRFSVESKVTHKSDSVNGDINERALIPPFL
jgi:hypothetical protein